VPGAAFLPTERVCERRAYLFWCGKIFAYICDVCSVECGNVFMFIVQLYSMSETSYRFLKHFSVERRSQMSEYFKFLHTFV